ncbi:hypothetical protein [Bordetella genomosp. 9]|uniref:DUF4156 domain-containing protein n=1 Tax=Bordetella genomosp. 9 TaxID=1416803 RepID=A0A1W6Z152_9BORD|nr:hypothetical protein [Bordetella genomosp. 9]ARP87085.1 hypothetical protein CAL13_13350 [Bordetella genomosp. 9]
MSIRTRGATSCAAARGAAALPAALLAGATAVLLAGCTAANSPIIPTGEPGQYTLTSRSGGLYTSWVELKRQALERARSYCESQGQKMTKPQVASNHATGLARAETYITFNCEPIPQPRNAGKEEQEGGNAGAAGSR